MKRILKTICNYGFFFLLIFAVNSCAHFKIKKLDKESLIPNNFYSFLSKEYLNFAKFELYEMHDEIDANYFAFKASQLINDKIFYPENPKDWDIPENYVGEANIMFNKLTNLIDKDLYKSFPEEFSKMMIGYDCWIEQIEENWQLEHIDECHDKFYKNFKLISNNLEEKDANLNNTNKIYKDNEAIIKKEEKDNIIEDKQIYKKVIFFEFDKFILSSIQLIELEKFIETAIQNKNMKIFIEGHTDTMGTNAYNLKLSDKRANFIKDYLLTLNLNNTIETKAYGEVNQLVTTHDEIKEKRNRRAELYLK